MKIFFSAATLFLLSFMHLVGAPLPEVTLLTPFVGPIAGGTVVDITGTGFTGATAVNFDNVPAASFVVNSDTSISATTPIYSPATVGVTVTAPSGTSIVTQDSYFTFQGDGFLYEANNISQTVSVIDTTTDLVIANPATGLSPSSLAFLPNGTKVYVGNRNRASGSITVYNTADHTLIATIPLAFAQIVNSIGALPNNTKVYLACNDGTVPVIDTATDTIITTISVQLNPVAVAITPSGAKTYIANRGSNTVSVIDTSNDTVATTIPVGNNPSVIAITPDGTTALVINTASNDVSVIDTTSDLVIATVAVGNTPGAIAITPDSTKAYVANNSDNTVSVIDIAGASVITTVTVGSGPVDLIITPDGTQAYVVNNVSADVSVINTANNQVTNTLVVGTDPVCIAMRPDGSKAYVTNTTTNNVSVIHTASQTVDQIAVDDFPLPIATLPDQAPLAKFSISAQDLTATFDASASVSPIDTIASYFWDFGDGFDLDTTNPIAEHTYAVAGTYTVTLTVTNTAGTSDSLIFNPAFSNFISMFVVFNGSSLTNNGGPSAVRVDTVTVEAPPISVFPPRDLRVRERKNIFLVQTEINNVLTWKPPLEGSAPVLYKIFRDAALTRLAAIVPANKRLKFVDHNRKECHLYRYFIVSVDEEGNQSEPAEIAIRDRCED